MTVIDDQDDQERARNRPSRRLLGRKNDLVIYCAASSAVLLFVAYLIFIDTDKPVVIIEGSSMVPNINSGDIVLLHRQDFSELKLGDIIAFNKKRLDESETTNPVVVHRIVEKRITAAGHVSLVTRGDFNLDNDDEMVSESNYEGKVYAVIPKAGFVAKGLQNPAIFAALLSVIVATFLIALKKRAS